jgi:hypothetical protein
MAEAAENTPAPVLDQGFEQALKDVEAKSVQAPAEQVEKPVSGSESESAATKEQPEGDQSAKPTKETPTEDAAAGMRLDDYTRKTQALAREREAHQADLEFATAWKATATAYHRASPDVQEEVKGLLEGRLQPRSKGAGPQGPASERVTKLLDSFEETDRAAVKDIFDTILSESEERANKKIAELQARLDETSSQTRQETDIRAAREAQEGFAAFDAECPEWKVMTDRERAWFQRDITEDPDLDPVAHFKSEFLPRLSSRAEKQQEPKTVPKAVQRASQAVLQPSTQTAAPRPKRIEKMEDAFALACSEKGF